MMAPNTLDGVPAFERSIARTTSVKQGRETDSIAHTVSGVPTIYVDNPKLFTSAVAAHELMHRVQDKAGSVKATGNSPAEYDYGGIKGLESLNQLHKTISSLTQEQQANIPQDYMTQMAGWRKKAAAGTLTKQDLANADRMNAAFARPIQQEAAMAADKINTTPAPPGAPPATLTGAITPLPEMGGPTIYAKGGEELTKEKALIYYRKAGHDPAKARELAKQDGWKVKGQ
jgi:hypothetical protein